MNSQTKCAPSYVRATEIILDEGRVFAQPGDVGEVVDAIPAQEGYVAVMVRFPGVPALTTCILGVDCEAVLTVVPLADSAQAPLLTREPPAARPWKRRAFAAAAAVLAGVVWCAAGGRPTPELLAETLPAVACDEMAADIARTLEGRLFAGRLPEKYPTHWKRKPCDGRQVAVNGACFLVLEQRPPCSDGYEHEGRCVVPVAAPVPTNQSVRRE